jgi:hypothetical protein
MQGPIPTFHSRAPFLATAHRAAYFNGDDREFLLTPRLNRARSHFNAKPRQ